MVFECMVNKTSFDLHSIKSVYSSMTSDSSLGVKKTSQVENKRRDQISKCTTTTTHAYIHMYARTYPGVPHAVSVGRRSNVFLANPKSAIFMSESSVSEISNAEC